MIFNWRGSKVVCVILGNDGGDLLTTNKFGVSKFRLAALSKDGNAKTTYSLTGNASDSRSSSDTLRPSVMAGISSLVMTRSRSKSIELILGIVLIK